MASAWRRGLACIGRQAASVVDAGGGVVARRTFYVIDITEILVHWYSGRSQHELAASLGVDRKTIRKYLAPAVAAGIRPGGPARSQAQWAELVRGWFPGAGRYPAAAGDLA